MDIITHALSGAAFTYVIPRNYRQWWFPIWGMIVGVIPEIDLLFITSTAEYFTIYKGITHSFAGAWGLSFLCALPLVFLTSLQPPTNKLPQPKNTTWSLIGAWLFAYTIILQHIWLDIMSGHGTQIFLPFNEYKVHLNSLFIIDLLLLIPLVLGFTFWRNNITIMVIILGWTIIYPTLTFGIKFGLETYLQRSYTSHNAYLSKNQNLQAIPNEVKVHLLPDAFTPFYWKIILDNKDHWDIAGYIAFTKPPEKFIRFEKPSLDLIATLKKHSPLFSTYQDFSTFLALYNSIQSTYENKYTFTDLRFKSTLPFINRLQQRHDNEEPFQFITITDNNNTPLHIRFTGINTHGDTGWVSPSHY